MKCLITGIAGFIGYHLAKRLAEAGHEIIGVDNINSYYDVNLKYARMKNLGFDLQGGEIIKEEIPSALHPNLRFIKMDITDSEKMSALFKNSQFEIVFHLAAQAGVRYALVNPESYISSNVHGFLNILEAIKLYPVKHLVYASSSSVYGNSRTEPFNETTVCERPISLYAVTKRSNELMAFAYAHMYSIPITGLRLFTVYGPYGRPDMAPFLFIDAISKNKPITVYNNGAMRRDFTYIEDVLQGFLKIMNTPWNSEETAKKTGRHRAPSKIYNLGYGSPVNIPDFIRIIERELGKKALIHYEPLQPGDVFSTWADCSSLSQHTGYHGQVHIEEGIKLFAAWYKDFYRS